jgi:hypothetical protein
MDKKNADRLLHDLLVLGIARRQREVIVLVELVFLEEWQNANERAGRDSLDAELAGRRQAFVRAIMPLHGNRDLMQVALAVRVARGLSRSLYRRQQQRHQHADDGDRHEQLDEREAGPSRHFHLALLNKQLPD